MFATKLLLQLSNKPCLNLLVCTELWNWNKNDDRLLVLDVNFLMNAYQTCVHFYLALGKLQT